MLRVVLATLELAFAVLHCLPAPAAEPSIGQLQQEIAALLRDSEPTRVAAAIPSTPATLAPSPPLVITVTPHCPAGDEAEAAIVAQLAAKRWKAGKHYAVVRAEDGPCPQFSWKGEAFSEDGWPGWDEWSRRLHEVMGVSMAGARPSSVVRTGAVERTVAAPVLSIPVRSTPQVWSEPHRFTPQVSIPPARRQWSYNGGGSLAQHLAQAHGINAAGMSHQDMVNAHSHAHEGTWGSVRGGYAMSAPVRRYAQPAMRWTQPVVMRSGCPGGMCPR